MGHFASYYVRRKGIPKTMGLCRRFCILLPPRAKGCRAGTQNIPARGMKGTSNGPSGTPAPTQQGTAAWNTGAAAALIAEYRSLS